MKHVYCFIIFSVICFLSFTISTNAQIPNEGFENWIPVGNIIEPVSWYSLYALIDSTGTYAPVTRSTDHYPVNSGSYSVRIANDTATWNSGGDPGNLLGWGMLLSSKLDDRPLFPVTGHPTSLVGFYKFFPENGDTMNINVHLYYHGTEITRGIFKSSVETANWTPFQAFFDDTLYSNVDSARITLSAANEPKDGSGGPRGNSVLYIDNLGFDYLITSVGSSSSQLPGSYTLEQNFPNPFNPTTKIQYSLPVESKVTLKLYTILGVEVATLIDGIQQAGFKSTQFDAANIPNGVYYYRIEAISTSNANNIFVEVKKMLLLK